MGNLEDHYERQKPIIPPFHVSYNNLVGVYLEISGLMIENVRRNPPEHCEWITIDSQELVGWELHHDWEGNRYEYILSDGRLVQTEYQKLNPRVIPMRKIDSSMTSQMVHEAGLLDFTTLREMCQLMVTIVPHNYGFPNHPKWVEWNNISRAYVNCY